MDNIDFLNNKSILVDFRRVNSKAFAVFYREKLVWIKYTSLIFGLTNMKMIAFVFYFNFYFYLILVF